MANVQRPTSPHLQIYKPQMSSVLSILNRITGVALGVGALLLAWWLIAAGSGPESYARAQGFLGSWLGMLLLVGFTWSLFFHLANGIRHLVWDLGLALDLPSMHRTGWATVAASVVLTLLAFLLAFIVRP